jgi:hypothetical protein
VIKGGVEEYYYYCDVKEELFSVEEVFSLQGILFFP